MKKLAALVSGLLLTLTAQAVEIADVSIPEQLQVKEQSLTLNGAGIRKMLFMELYVGSLYTEEQTSSANEVLDSDTPVAIRLDIVSGMITSDKMASTVNEGFEVATEGNLAPLQERLDDFISVFQDEIVEGDQFTLVANPGQGLDAYKNGQFLITIEGDDFSKALFTIWLGEEPADDKLKDAMLNA